MNKPVITALTLLAASAAFGAELAASPPPLTFAWPANMTCKVTQKQERPGSPDAITSRYLLTSAREGENLHVGFTGFQIVDTFAGVPARAKARFIDSETGLGRTDVEREFSVTTAGRFVGAESPENLKRRLSTGNPSRNDALPLFLMAAGDQEKLDSTYRMAWQDFIGNWIGLVYSPGETQQIKYEPKSEDFSLDYDVPTEVTVSHAVDCTRGGKTLRCVTIRSHFAPAYKRPGDSEKNSMRPSFDAEIVVEPDTLIPHAWTDEKRYRGGSFSGQLEVRNARTFDCG